MPIPHDDTTLPELFVKARRDDVKQLIVIARRVRLKNLKTAPHGETRCNGEHIFAESPVLRVGHLIQNVPRDQHRHDDSLSRAGCHLGAQSSKLPAVAGYIYSDPVGRGTLDKPDQRFNRLKLAEKESSAVALLRIVPVFEEFLRYPRCAFISVACPRFNSRTDLIDQRQLSENSGIIKGPRPGVAVT